jgi:hypothetical protein
MPIPDPSKDPLKSYHQKILDFIEEKTGLFSKLIGNSYNLLSSNKKGKIGLFSDLCQK